MLMNAICSTPTSLTYLTNQSGTTVLTDPFYNLIWFIDFGLLISYRSSLLFTPIWVAWIYSVSKPTHKIYSGLLVDPKVCTGSSIGSPTVSYRVIVSKLLVMQAALYINMQLKYLATTWWKKFLFSVWCFVYLKIVIWRYKQPCIHSLIPDNVRKF